MHYWLTSCIQKLEKVTSVGPKIIWNSPHAATSHPVDCYIDIHWLYLWLWAFKKIIGNLYIPNKLLLKLAPKNWGWKGHPCECSSICIRNKGNRTARKLTIAKMLENVLFCVHAEWRRNVNSVDTGCACVFLLWAEVRLWLCLESLWCPVQGSCPPVQGSCRPVRNEMKWASHLWRKKYMERDVGGKQYAWCIVIFWGWMVVLSVMGEVERGEGFIFLPAGSLFVAQLQFPEHLWNPSSQYMTVSALSARFGDLLVLALSFCLRLRALSVCLAFCFLL